MVNEFLFNMFQNHQVKKFERLIEEGVAVDEAVHILQDDNRFFFNNVMKARWKMKTEILIPAILGSFIGFLIYSFIKGLTNDLFYRLGFLIGNFIANLFK